MGLGQKSHLHEKSQLSVPVKYQEAKNKQTNKTPILFSDTACQKHWISLETFPVNLSWFMTSWTHGGTSLSNSVFVPLPIYVENGKRKPSFNQHFTQFWRVSNLNSHFAVSCRGFDKQKCEYQSALWCVLCVRNTYNKQLRGDVGLEFSW